MSHCETKGWAECDHCGEKVAVKLNRSGRPYYRCDHCGVQVQHHWGKTSSKVIQSLGNEEAEEEEKPEPKAKAKQEAPPPPKHKPGSLASMFGGI